MQQCWCSRAEAAGRAKLLCALALQLRHVDVGAEGQAGVRVVEEQNLVGALVGSKFFGGVVDEVPVENSQGFGV